ncbi:Leucine-rich repeat (LRR) protein [Streptomyces sp. TE3672]
MDPAILQSITNETGLSQPFPSEALKSVTYLHVSYARSLNGLSKFPKLEILQLTGCDPVDLSQLGELPELFSLVVNFSNLKDLTGIGERFPRLRRFEAGMNRIEDLTPLLECPNLRRLDIRGNPLSEDSFREIPQKLKSNGVRVSLSEEPDWRMNLELQRHGLPLGFYHAHDGTRLCRTGLAETNLPDLSHPIVSREALAGVLARDPAEVQKLFDRADLMPTTIGP